VQRSLEPAAFGRLFRVESLPLAGVAAGPPAQAVAPLERPRCRRQLTPEGGQLVLSQRLHLRTPIYQFRPTGMRTFGERLACLKEPASLST